MIGFAPKTLLELIRERSISLIILDTAWRPLEEAGWVFWDRTGKNSCHFFRIQSSTGAVETWIAPFHLQRWKIHVFPPKKPHDVAALRQFPG